LAVILGVSGVAAPHAQTASALSCDVTPMNPPFSNASLTVFGPDANGETVFRAGGPGFVTSDGALGMKFGWQRHLRGTLTVEGRRIDGAAAALRSEVNPGYGDIGFQASYLIFPTPGCWEVTGRVGDASLTFITRVVLIGDGPSWRRGR
jgi:hypothetical protein